MVIAHDIDYGAPYKNKKTRCYSWPDKKLSNPFYALVIEGGYGDSVGLAKLKEKNGKLVYDTAQWWYRPENKLILVDEGSPYYMRREHKLELFVIIKRKLQR